MDSSPILFDSSNYYELTNFSCNGALTDLDGVKYPSAEHYYQCQKLEDHPNEFTAALKIVNPIDMRHYVRATEIKPKDWEDIKELVMKRALFFKFSQSIHLTDLLLSTRGRELIKNCPQDSYWGNGEDGKGKNRLGILIMQLRDDLSFLVP